jgi:hypothetical protein
MSIGDVVGTSGADDICNSLAAAHDLPGDYVAWVSEPGAEATVRLGAGYDGPWRTWDPELELWTALVAENLADLTDGTIGAKIGWTEKGAATPETCLAWTGTTASGALAADDDPATGGSCGAWVVSEPTSLGLAGRCNATDGQWSQWGPVPCSQSLHVYCFQLASPPPPDPNLPPEGCGDASCSETENAESCAADCDPDASCKDKCDLFEEGWPCSCTPTCADEAGCCADMLWWCPPVEP